MLLQFLIKELTEKLQVTRDMTFAYHFCDNRMNAILGTATGLLRQLLFQLFQQRPDHIPLLQRIWDYQGKKLFENFDSLWSIFVEVLEQYGEGELFILIDALDSCDRSSRTQLMEGLKEISNSNLRVRIFYTCQPEEDIEREHRSGHRSTATYWISQLDIANDLDKWLYDKVAKICERHGWGEKEEEVIRTTLAPRSGGIFLWCAFVLEDIDKLSHKVQIQHALKSLPHDLLQIYRRMTSNYANGAKTAAKTVLEIVAGTRRPLRRSELALAYVLAEDSPDRWTGPHSPSSYEISVNDDVYQWCGRLLRYDIVTDSIHSVHPSAVQYLKTEYLAHRIASGEGGSEGISRRTATRLNTILLEIIFRLFSFPEFDELNEEVRIDNESLTATLNHLLETRARQYDNSLSSDCCLYFFREWKAHAEAFGETLERYPTETMAFGERFIKYLTIRKPLFDSWTQEAYDKGKNQLGDWLKSKGGKGYPVRYNNELNHTDSDGWETEDSDCTHSDTEDILA